MSRVLFLALFPVLALAQNPFAGNAAEADAGRGLFRIMCAPCHGIQAQGGRGPDLTLGVYNAGSTDQDLYRVIADGVPGTEMPGYGARVNEGNVWRLVSYIRSITVRNQTPPNGDRAAGEQYFWNKGGCGNCHRVGDRGGVLGPDLTRAGRKRSLAYLRHSVVDPNVDITPGYFKLTATTSTGRKITGVQKGFDNFSCQVLTMDGSVQSFARGGSTNCEREFVSLMPAYKNLSPAELDNLLTYLLSLRGEGN
jgi:putative heme-binding domain-containing protein